MKNKKLNLVDWVTILGILSSAALVLMYSTGCATTLTKVEDPKECCHRLSLHNQEMGKFTRYCKLALYIKQSNLKDKKVMDIAEQGVRICKFVLGVDQDGRRISKKKPNDEKALKVRSYIYEKESFWLKTLPCDPAETFCEEF